MPARPETLNPPRTAAGQSVGALPCSVSFAVTPMGKPRMTQRDKWKKRDVVVRYHAFKDELRLCVNQIPNLRATIESGIVDTLSWTAFLPMPASWSKRRKADLAGTLHRAKPDRDNIDKAIMDALFTDDSGIASGTIVKRWDDGNGPRIEVRFSSQNANARYALADATGSMKAAKDCYEKLFMAEEKAEASRRRKP